MSRALTDLGHDALLEELRARELDADNVPKLPGSRFRRLHRATMRVPTARIAAGRIALERHDTPEIVDVVRNVQYVVYGVDDRRELHAVDDPAIRHAASAVVALVHESALHPSDDGALQLQGQTFESAYHLCAHERFAAQPSIASCTGFLADPSFVVTAGHCISSANLDALRFVFGYEMEDADTVRPIDPADVRRPLRIIGRHETSGGADWAVVQLDAPVLHRPSLAIRRQGSIDVDTPLHIIGHPAGIPKKYAAGAAVRDTSHPAFFVANLDSYGGNSGSPVFNADTHEVEGVLVRGETDFVWTGGCYVSNICPSDDCRGEDCTRTTAFEHLVPRRELSATSFAPADARLTRIGGTWQIVANDVSVRTCGTDADAARRMLDVITHYGCNLRCVIGDAPGAPAMEFYLVDGAAPQGPMDGDDCIGFDPDAIEVRRASGRWKLVDGDAWLLDFGQNETHARQALSAILRYRFQNLCFVGRSDDAMTYFRQ